MKKRAWALTTTAVLLSGLILAAGCAAGVDAETAPKTSATPTTSSQEPFQDTSSDATEGASEPTEEPTEDSTEQTANFNQSYTYSDDVKIEVTKVKHGKVSKSDAEYADGVKAGADYVEMSVKVTNGSGKKLKDLSSYQTVTFGPDGDEADDVYLSSSNRNYVSVDGTLLPKKSKVALIRVAIPKKYQDDVTLEFDFDSDHESAVFTGSVK